MDYRQNDEEESTINAEDSVTDLHNVTEEHNGIGVHNAINEENGTDLEYVSDEEDVLNQNNVIEDNNNREEDVTEVVEDREVQIMETPIRTPPIYDIRELTTDEQIVNRCIIAITAFQLLIRVGDAEAYAAQYDTQHPLYKRAMRSIIPVFRIYPYIADRARAAIIKKEELDSHITTVKQTCPVRKTTARDLEEKCSICISFYKPRQNIRTLVCLHYFHNPCIMKWCKTSLTWPVCRLVYDGNRVSEERIVREGQSDLLFTMEYVLRHLLNKRKIESIKIKIN